MTFKGLTDKEIRESYHFYDEKFADLHIRAVKLGLQIDRVNDDNYTNILKSVKEKEREKADVIETKIEVKKTIIEEPIDNENMVFGDEKIEEKPQPKNEKIKSKNKPKRKRSNSILLRMNDEENEILENLSQVTGKSKNTLLLTALKNINFNDLDNVKKLADDIKINGIELNKRVKNWNSGEHLSEIKEELLTYIGKGIDKYTERINEITVELEQEMLGDSSKLYNEKAVKDLVVLTKKMTTNLKQTATVIKKQNLGYDQIIISILKKMATLEDKNNILKGMIFNDKI